MILHLCTYAGFWLCWVIQQEWQNTSTSFKYLQPPQNSSLYRTKGDPRWHPWAPVQPGYISCWAKYSFQKWIRWPPPILRGERWRLSSRSDSFITRRPDIQSWNRTRRIKWTSRQYTRLIMMPCIILPENHRNNVALPKLNFKTSAWELKAARQATLPPRSVSSECTENAESTCHCPAHILLQCCHFSATHKTEKPAARDSILISIFKLIVSVIQRHRTGFCFYFCF